MVWWILFFVWALIALPPLAKAAWQLKKTYQYETDDTLETSWSRVLYRVVWAFAAGYIVSLADRLMDTYVYHLWFQELGYSGRYWTVWWTKTSLFWTGLLVSAACMYFVLRKVYRDVTRMYGKEHVVLKPGLVGIGFGASLYFAFKAEHLWLKLQLALHAQRFGTADPIFGNDIGFYVFRLPLLDALVSYAFWLLGVAAAFVILIFAAYAVANAAQIDNYQNSREEKEAYRAKRNQFIERGLTHLAAIGIAWMVVLSINTFLARYFTLYSTHGKVYGAGWTDINITIPAYWVFQVVIGICIWLLMRAIKATDHLKTLRHAALGFGAAVLFWIGGLQVLPAIFQSTYVSPNEQQVESQYIQHELDFTRVAYGIDKIQVKPFEVKNGITTENLKNDTQALESARIWDAGTLANINRQLQTKESFHEFRDEDVERYVIGGKKTQLYYSSRELDVDQLQEAARTSWQNRHLVYTHGYGGVVNPVNSFTATGHPEYLLKGMPVETTVPELRLVQPRTYFSYRTDEHVYVNTREDEYDYTGPDSKPVKFRYDGPAGFTIGGFWKRMVIASQFDGVFHLFSGQLKDDSRLLIHRNIYTRTQGVVPFFWHDSDPYQVIADGQIWTIRDFFTASEWYPYSAPFNGLNYQRNSVKAVVNAYTGKTDFYVWDDTDPVVKAYQAIFPDLFKPASAMPASLRQHVRYPASYLDLQADVYATYHMSDVDGFYNKSDAWQFARHFAPNHGTAQPLTAYYAQVALPDNQQTEYVTIQLYTTMSTKDKNSRGTLKAWLVGRADNPNYGKLISYQFNSREDVQGPVQVGSKFNSHPLISKDFTLWNQQGSEVHMGGARVLPLSDNRLLTTQAVYMKAVGAPMATLQYVIVFAGDDIYYDRTFAGALNQLVNQGPQIVPPPPSGLNVMPAPPDYAQQIFQRIDRLGVMFKSGDWVKFGAEMQGILSDREQMKKQGK